MGDRFVFTDVDRRTPSLSRTPQVIAVVAMTPDYVIGRDGDMPWRLSTDLQRFKRVTMGGVLLMGRKTFDSIGRPLPGRTTVVVTRQEHWRADGVSVAGDPDSALDVARELAGLTRTERVFVVGGAEIYRALLDRCQELWLTLVWSAVAGDTELPIDSTRWRRTEVMRLPAGGKDLVPSEYWRYLSRGR